MGLVQEIPKKTERKTLVSVCVNSISKSLAGDLDPDRRAFLDFMKEARGSAPSNKTFFRKFVVIQPLEGGRMAYFIHPSKHNKRKISVPPLSSELVKKICKECGSSGVSFVRDDSKQADAIAGVLGRVGSDTYLGKIVLVVD